MSTTWRPHHRAPLGLPPGSVRALLTLLIVAVVIVETGRGHRPDLLWSETLMIVLAHYFSSRRLLDLPPDVRRQLEESGVLQPEPQPLYLPRNTIRVLIIGSFVGVAIYLYKTGKLWTQKDGRLVIGDAIQSIWVVFAYFLGVVLRWLVDWWCRVFQIVPRWWWRDTKALAALLLTGVCAVFYFVGRPDLIPDWQRDVVLGVILFYFGSR